MFCGQICFTSSGLCLPKQILLHGDYLHCNALWLTSDGYSNQDVSHALYATNKQWNKTEEPTGTAMLPYQHPSSNKISRLLAKCDMQTHHLTVKKTTQEKIGLKTPSVWCIPCGYGKVLYQTSRSLETRCKEHMRHFSWASQRIRMFHGYRTAWNLTAFTEWLR